MINLDDLDNNFIDKFEEKKKRIINMLFAMIHRERMGGRDEYRCYG
jgi:hypothetical protein